MVDKRTYGGRKVHNVFPAKMISYLLGRNTLYESTTDYTLSF